MKIARKNGRVTKRELVAEADVGKTKATETLKALASKGMLEWNGSAQARTTRASITALSASTEPLLPAIFRTGGQ